jgi:hypothetical protein
MESSPNIFNWLMKGLNGESQEDGVRSWPAESATGPIKKIPYRGRVTVWPSPSVPCGLGFLVMLSRYLFPFTRIGFLALADRVCINTEQHSR